MVATSFVPLPEGIVTMPPGAGLATALATVDPRKVAPRDTATLLAASRRQLSHTEAVHAVALRECALADPGEPGGRREDVGRHGGDEPRAVLSESRTRIQNALDVAEGALERLPALGDAWARGDLDADRVRLLGTWTRALSDQHAAVVVATVLPEATAAPGLTLSALIDRIKEVATDLDPAWAKRMYDLATGQRRVRARRTDAGTVNLSGLDLPLDEATRSVTHIAALAAQAKAAGHSGGIDTIRAEVYLLLLSPRSEAMDDEALVRAVMANAGTAHAPAGAEDPHAVPDPEQAPPDMQPWTAAGESDEQVDPPEHRETGHSEHGQPGEPAGPTGRGRRLPRQARIELRVALSTLLGLDDKPARMPGHGVVHAELARELAMSHYRGQWQIAVVDDAGALSASLLTRRRPRNYVAGAPLSPGAPAATVELHVTETELATVDPHQHPHWAAVITDLHTQLREWERARTEDHAATAAEHTAAALDSVVAHRVARRRRARACEAWARFPSAALRRWIEQRDRACRFPTCGATASRCEIDHTIEVIAGGLTVPINLGPACAHDHRAKGPGGWQLHQHRPGHFTWTSPTGNQYPSGPPRIVPDLPGPLPPEQQDRSDPLPREYADHGSIWHNNPYPPLAEEPSDEPDDPPAEPYPEQPPF